MKKISSLIVFLLLTLFISSNSLAGSYAGVNVLVTDLSGVEHNVTDTDLFTIDLAVVKPGAPREWFLIRAANISEVIFTRNKDITSVSVSLKDGSQLAGISTQQDESINGKGTLGSDFGLPMNKVKRIQFLSTHVPDQFTYQHYLFSNWKITDGDTVVSARTLILIDSFLDNRDWGRGGIKTNQFEKRSTWHGLNLYAELILLQGDADLRVPFKGISLIEITGRMKDGKPEVRIEKMDGTSATVDLYFVAKYDGNKASFNGFEDEDYYAWDDKSFGIRARSLKPLRKITFKQLK
jgi:hypothetical protein